MKVVLRHKLINHRNLRVLLALCAVAISACDSSSEQSVPALLASESRPGGAGTVGLKPRPSYSLPAANLPEASRPDFYAGKALAEQPWIKAPTATDARDGLGPLYNARTCLACHINGGRGPLPQDGESPLFAAFVRVSLPGRDSVEGAVADPVYGLQIQGQSTALSHQLRSSVAPKAPGENPEAPPEAYVYIDWVEQHYTYSDGAEVSLRRPELRFENLGYGGLSSQLQTSLRAAPAIHGVGLLEAIAQQDIEAWADPEDRNGDGISGRINRVWNFAPEGKTVAGRFGWKANRSDLHVVTASAFNGDVGITSPMFPQQPCSAAQQRCLRAPTGNGEQGVELPQHLLDLVVFFVRNLGVPASRIESSSEGRALFHTAGCAACHRPSYQTTVQAPMLAHLGEQTIWPYSDLLLHDMGPALADGRPDYDATGSEWRTPPLWGLGLSRQVNGSANLLHDGRARTVEEAVLWHGGEALAAREKFTALKPKQRRALIEFVESL